MSSCSSGYWLLVRRLRRSTTARVQSTRSKLMCLYFRWSPSQPSLYHCCRLISKNSSDFSDSPLIVLPLTLTSESLTGVMLLSLLVRTRYPCRRRARLRLVVSTPRGYVRQAALDRFRPWTEKRTYREADPNAWTACGPLGAWKDLEAFSILQRLNPCWPRGVASY
jgi:hypothetical protein